MKTFLIVFVKSLKLTSKSAETFASNIGLTFFIEIFLFSKNFLACLISSPFTAMFFPN